MGITEIARLPTLTSLSLLNSHLHSNHSTSQSSKWTLTISSYRSNPFSTSSQTVPPSNQKARILWTVNDTSYPGITFVFIEDNTKPDRASYRRQNQNNSTRNRGNDQSQIQIQGKSVTDMDVDGESTTPAILNLSHPRFQSHVVSDSFLPLLLRTNLPPPLGIPSNDSRGGGSSSGEKSKDEKGVAGSNYSNSSTFAGPGSWEKRGNDLLVQGSQLFVGELDQRLETDVANRRRVLGVRGTNANEIEGDGRETRVRIGIIQSGVGTGRNLGSLFELEYLPLEKLTESSPFLPSMIYSLLPPTFLNPNLVSTSTMTNQNRHQQSQQTAQAQSQSQSQSFSQPQRQNTAGATISMSTPQSQAHRSDLRSHQNQSQHQNQNQNRNQALPTPKNQSSSASQSIQPLSESSAGALNHSTQKQTQMTMQGQSQDQHHLQAGHGAPQTQMQAQTQSPGQPQLQPQAQAQAQAQTQVQIPPPPIILSSSVIQSQNLAEAIPTLLSGTAESVGIRQVRVGTDLHVDPNNDVHDARGELGDEDEEEEEDETELDRGWTGLERGRRSALMVLLMLKNEGLL